MNAQARSSEREFALTEKKMEPTHVGCYRILILLALLLCTPRIYAADFTADFSAANELYAKGKFSDAANLYEKILNSGAASPNLLFNYANAEFKSGHLGQAIAAYRQAALLSPRDSEIRANLQFVRNQVSGPTIREGHWQGWLDQLTLNEWTLLVAGAFWLTFILLVTRQIRPAWGARLKRATLVFAVLTILSGVALGLQAAEHFARQTAVVISPEATARSGPFDEAQDAFTAHDGSELAVLDRHSGWVQVVNGSAGSDGYKKIGWLPVKQVEVLPGA